VVLAQEDSIVAEDYDEYSEMGPEMEPIEELDYEAILADYRRRQMMEHLTGPIVSLVAHMIMIVLGIFFLVSTPSRTIEDIEVTMEELEIKEIEPRVLEELEKLEQLAEEVVPTVAQPEISVDAVSDEPVSTEDFNDEMAETDNDMDMSEVLDIKTNPTALKLPGLYGGRTNAGRKAALRKHGGSAKTESAVLRALRWLKDHQNEDGSWSRSEPRSMCGLALLSFLSHGETPASEEFGPTVQRAMQYLANQMMAGRVRKGYRNGIATYALSESYGLTKIPFLKGAMEEGVQKIIDGQMGCGGWNYGYSQGDRWDLSVGGWQLQAMKAAYVAGAENSGLEQAIKKGLLYLKKVAFANNRFGYSKAGAGSAAMQGAGTLCLQLLGEGKSKEAKAGCGQIEKRTLNWAQCGGHGTGAYAWYYETQSMFHHGTKTWRPWNKMFRPVLLKNQHEDGHWEPIHEVPKGGDASKKRTPPEYEPYMITCFCCLMLQVYYRYLPTYKMPEKIVKAEEGGMALDDDDMGLVIE